MMSSTKPIPSVLSHAIRDGTFPDSDEVLAANLTSDTVVALLQDISRTKQQLDVEVQQISQSLASGVDGWIAQAKRVQEDIAKCKAEARKIVEENESLETQRHEAREAASRVELLQHEIEFASKLQQELHSVQSIAQSIQDGPQTIEVSDRKAAANALAGTRLAISNVPAPRIQALLSEHTEDLIKTLKDQLQYDFNALLRSTSTQIRAICPSIGALVPVNSMMLFGRSTQTATLSTSSSPS